MTKEPMTKEPYEAPALTEIGTLHELTLKSGPGTDFFSFLLGPGSNILN